MCFSWATEFEAVTTARMFQFNSIQFVTVVVITYFPTLFHHELKFVSLACTLADLACCSYNLYVVFADACIQKISYSMCARFNNNLHFFVCNSTDQNEKKNFVCCLIEEEPTANLYPCKVQKMLMRLDFSTDFFSIVNEKKN